jgi:hypothetical protein
MSLQEAHRAFEGAAAINRLNYLDDLWTVALLRPQELEPADIREAVDIAEEMRQVLKRLRDEAGWARQVIASDAHGFDRRAKEILESTGGDQQIKSEVADLFGRRGWAVEADQALRDIQESQVVDAELSDELGRLAGGGMAAGDFKLPFKCSLFVAGSAMVIVGTLLTPGAALIAAGEVAVAAAHFPEMCRGVMRERSQLRATG